jgi:translin
MLGDDLTLKSFIRKIQKELKSKEEAKEKVQKDMRRATRLSKQAILLTHQRRFDDAKKLLEEVDTLFRELRKVEETHPDLVYSGIVDVAMQEYAEAKTLLGLTEENRFVAPEELNVSSVAYMLGLADVIGELRRQALDYLRAGNVKGAEHSLQLMEHIYVELMSMNEAYMLVPGLRRKCDLARRVIETTRGDITIEARRDLLEKSIKRLEKVFERKRKASGS